MQGVRLLAVDTNTDKKYNEQRLASLWNYRFKEAMVTKAPYTKRWQTYIDAYNGDYFKNEKLPEYKSDLVSNYIFSIIETIRPIMLENNPKFQAIPRNYEGMEFSNDVNEAMSYEWDREGMKQKLSKELINTLVLGTSVFFVHWNSEERNVKAIPVNPFNIFPDPLATCIEDAEYIIYASYKNVVKLKRKFPAKADELRGGSIQYSELVNENDKNSNINNQVLVLEIWTWGIEDEYDLDGNEIRQNRYPNGRVITICPELGIVLEDKPNPYKAPPGEVNTFPFILIKDYDIPGKFWGEGEVVQLLSPQKHMNQLNNAIIDNAKATANMPWIIDRNAGIPHGAITARPGLIIRKNPNSEVRREQPPQMPVYVTNAVEIYKSDMEQISGMFNALKGDSVTGVYTAQGILALQEAGQVRIRLKVDLLEYALGKLAKMWFNRMWQYWKEDRWIRITKPDGSYDIKILTSDVFNYNYDIKITAGSTMPVNRSAMLDLMIRLAQTPMPDGQPLVDRQAVAEYLPEEVKSSLLKRMGNHNANLEELKQAITQLSQEIQQVAQQSDANDEKAFQLIEEITSTLERVNQQILQLKEEHDKIELERQEQDKIDQLKKQAYNKGYADAEQMYIESVSGEGLDEMSAGVDDIGALPDDILEGLENMSDDELAVLLEQNPELTELIR